MECSGGGKLVGSVQLGDGGMQGQAEITFREGDDLGGDMTLNVEGARSTLPVGVWQVA